MQKVSHILKMCYHNSRAYDFMKDNSSALFIQSDILRFSVLFPKYNVLQNLLHFYVMCQLRTLLYVFPKISFTASAFRIVFCLWLHTPRISYAFENHSELAPPSQNSQLVPIYIYALCAGAYEDVGTCLAFYDKLVPLRLIASGSVPCKRAYI
jgi:hypothetical protein